jgi:hypothetical protein
MKSKIQSQSSMYTCRRCGYKTLSFGAAFVICEHPKCPGIELRKIERGELPPRDTPPRDTTVGVLKP